MLIQFSTMKMKPKFVKFMPENLEEGFLYISLEYGSVIHLCACGCGEEINTPLSPTGWKFTYDGKHIDLDPSIGNWNYSCRSHYWIKDNEVEWASDWSEAEIKINREYDKIESESYYDRLYREENKPENNLLKNKVKLKSEKTKSFWSKFIKWIGL